MKIDNLRLLLAAPLAVVFLILILCIFAQKRSPAMGLRVPVPSVRTFPVDDCNDDRSIWVLLLKSGMIRIDETPIPRGELKLRISQIYAHREEPNAAFMLVDPEASYGDFVDVYDDVVSASPSLRVGVMTDGLMRLLKACPAGASCGLDWPDHKYIPWCLYYNIPPQPQSVVPKLHP